MLGSLLGASPTVSGLPCVTQKVTGSLAERRSSRVVVRWGSRSLRKAPFEEIWAEHGKIRGSLRATFYRLSLHRMRIAEVQPQCEAGPEKGGMGAALIQ